MERKDGKYPPFPSDDSCFLCSDFSIKFINRLISNDEYTYPSLDSYNDSKSHTFLESINSNYQAIEFRVDLFCQAMCETPLDEQKD